MDFILPQNHVYKKIKCCKVNTEQIERNRDVTPLGEYEIKKVSGNVLAIHPESFFRKNWKPLSRIAGFAFPPKLNLLERAEHCSTFFGISTALNTRHHEVWLYPPKLQEDVCAFCKENGQLVGGLWAISATIFRMILIAEGIIPCDQLVGARAARRGGFLKRVTRSIHKQIGELPSNNIAFRTTFDAWVVFHAVYGYVSLHALDEEVDTDEIRKIIRAEKDEIKPKFFP